MRFFNTAKKIEPVAAAAVPVKAPPADVDHSHAIKAIRDFANSPAMKVLRDYAEQPEVKAMADGKTPAGK